MHNEKDSPFRLELYFQASGYSRQKSRAFFRREVSFRGVSAEKSFFSKFQILKKSQAKKFSTLKSEFIHWRAASCLAFDICAGGEKFMSELIFRTENKKFRLFFAAVGKFSALLHLIWSMVSTPSTTSIEFSRLWGTLLRYSKSVKEKLIPFRKCQK